MATDQDKTIVGVFEDRMQAQRAVNELKRSGFTDDQIGVVSREEEGTTRTEGDADESYAGEGAAAGLAAGAGVGALWGLGIVAGVLPVIGPAIAGGTLAAILSSAAAGAAAAGLAGALIGMGIPREEAEYYESELHAGRTIVTVQGNGRAIEARSILQSFGAYDATTRRANAEHMSMDDAGGRHTPSAHTTAPAAGRTGDRSGRIQVKEEELRAKKSPAETGEVHVKKDVHTEHKTIDVPVEREEVTVERHPTSGRQPASGEVGTDQDIRVPIREEEVHVEKTPVVKEEIDINKRKVRDTEHVSADVRKEDVDIEKQGKARRGRR